MESEKRMKIKAVSGIMLTLLLIGMLSTAFNISLLAAGTEEETELTIRNPDGCTVSGSVVYWTFEIIDPYKVAAPGETVYFRMRITNLPGSDTPLQAHGAGMAFIPGLLPAYGNPFFDVPPYPTVAIGETYEGPFGHFTWTTAVPIGYVQGGYMSINVYNGSPGFRDVPYSVTIVPPSPVISATIDIDPNTLNFKSKGQWITAYIQLPEEHNPEDIDATTILLNGTIQPVLDPKYDFVTNSSEYIVDHDGDGILERMVKFNRTEVASWICSDLGIEYDNVTLTITGKLFDGTPFEGIDTIKVLFPSDVDDDGDVDFDDFYIFSRCYGISIENLSYNPLADFDEDGYINSEDLHILSDNYGKTAV